MRLHQELRDADVYLVQSTGLLRAVHRSSITGESDRLTARRRRLPRRGHAHHRRSALPRPCPEGPSDHDRPPGLHVVADVLRASHVDRLVVFDPHAPALESILRVPVETTTAVPLLADALRRYAGHDAVLVAPDLGAAKLVDRYAALLDLDVAIVRKTRVSGEKVAAGTIVGDVEGRRPIVIDDMISTGGTIESTAEALTTVGAVGPPVIAATHSLLVGPAIARLDAIRPDVLVTTDSVAVPNVPWPLDVRSLADRLWSARSSGVSMRDVRSTSSPRTADSANPALAY